jgi:hypothetical protein
MFVDVKKPSIEKTNNQCSIDDKLLYALICPRLATTALRFEGYIVTTHSTPHALGPS